LAILAALIAIFVPLFVLRHFAVASRPSDAPRIKRDLEGAGRHVIAIRRIGWEAGGQGRPWYRKYEAVIDDSVKGRSTVIVGVEVTLISDPRLKTY